MYRKRNKRIFEPALEKAELQPEDVWYIGAIDMKYEPREDVFAVQDWKE